MTQILEHQEVEHHSLKDCRLIRFADQYLELKPEGKAQICASLQSHPRTNKLEITVFLQRYDGGWTTVKKWNKSCWGAFCSFNCITDIKQMEQYRIEVLYRAYQGAYVEEVYSLEN